ncbi:hypothetical protein D3C87_1970020 [compost metagenome]
MDHANDVVGGAAPEGHAGIGAVQHGAHRDLRRIVGIHRTHGRAVDHDIGQFQFAEIEQPTQPVAVDLDHRPLAMEQVDGTANLLMR